MYIPLLILAPVGLLNLMTYYDTFATGELIFFMIKTAWSDLIPNFENAFK